MNEKMKWTIVVFSVLCTIAQAQVLENYQPRCKYVEDVSGVKVEGRENSISFTDRGYANYSENLEFTNQDMEAYRGMRVADIGAGLSDFTDVMADYFGADAVAIDIAYDQLKLANVSEACLDLFHRRHFSMDARNLRFPNNYFDLVVSNYPFNWFFFGSLSPSKARVIQGFEMLEEIIRVIAVKGSARLSHVPEPKAAWIQGNLKEAVVLYAQKMKALQKKYKGIVEFSFGGDESRLTVLRKLKAIPNQSLQKKVKTGQN